MSSGTFGKKAVELVREIADSEPGSIPPYNQDLIRTVIDQCEDHHRELGRLASEYTDATTALEGAADEEEDERDERLSTQNRVRVGMLAHHQALLRNKRAMLVYLNERMNRVKELRWEIGTGLPESASANLSHSERNFFTKYSENLNEYMRAVDLNLTLDLEPPRHHKIQVRCLEDRGELFTRDGFVDLRKNTVHLLWREEAEPLIREGVLEQLDDD